MTPPRPSSSQFGWMMTFADLLGLLLCFFVMTYASRAIQPESWAGMRDTLVGRFGVVADHTHQTNVEPVEEQGQYLETWLQARIAEQPDLDGVLIEHSDRGIGLRLSRSMELTETAAKLLVSIVERVDNQLLLVLPAGTVSDLNDAAEQARTLKAALIAAGLTRPVSIVLDPAVTDPALVLSMAKAGGG